MNRIKYTVFFAALLIGSVAHAQEVKPPLDEREVKLFAYTSLLAIYDFDYKNYLSRQKQAAETFTGSGWLNFQQALIKSKLLEAVKKNKYSVTTVPLAPPVITQRGLVKGVYQWTVQLPAMVVFKNEAYQQVQYLDLTMLVLYQQGLKLQSVATRKRAPLNCEQTSPQISLNKQQN